MTSILPAKRLVLSSRVGDGIAYIDGVDHAMYGEILVFDNGLESHGAGCA